MRKEAGRAKGRGTGRGRGTVSRGKGKKVASEVDMECDPVDNDGNEEKEEDTCKVDAVQHIAVICETDDDYLDDVETFHSLQDDIHEHLVNSDIFDN